MVRRRRRLKRVIDIAVALGGLAIALPVMAVAALAIKIESPGPVFFRQERVGRGGATFRIHKFRSMTVSHDGRLVSATGDARVTRVGRLLRRSKLDEVPQLIDVLRGKMSLVGPRPEVPQYVDMWPEERRAVILSVRPGMTDPASITFRNEADELASVDDPESHYTQVLLPQKTAAYVDYVNGQSTANDMAILLETVRAVVTR